MLMLASKHFYKENVNIMIFTDDVYHLFNVVTFTNFKLWWKSRTLPKLLQFIIWGSRITKVFETNHIGTTILVFYTIFHCHPPNICWDISLWIKVVERLTDRQKRDSDCNRGWYEKLQKLALTAAVFVEMASRKPSCICWVHTDLIKHLIMKPGVQDFFFI